MNSNCAESYWVILIEANKTVLCNTHSPDGSIEIILYVIPNGNLGKKWEFEPTLLIMMKSCLVFCSNAHYHVRFYLYFSDFVFPIRVYITDKS